MSRYYSYLNSAVTIIDNYNGDAPFANYTKQFFSANKKYGSKDRKQITHLCYCYFRVAIALAGLSVRDKIVAGLFLCSDEENAILQILKPEWSNQVSLPIKDKFNLINAGLRVEQLFPWLNECSDGLSATLFAESFLHQPDLFLRIRPGKLEQVLAKLKAASIDFALSDDTCIGLSNNTKIDTVLAIDKEVVIQDLNSQRVATFFPDNSNGSIRSVWDCCAASGGKAILAKDYFENIEITVSDVRESILFNLRKRFAAAGITDYQSFVADLANLKQPLPSKKYDLVIADVPCSGSGTWSRTPEQLYYFNKTKIDEYAALQKSILENIVDKVKPGGYLLYITCSVFKKENEDAVSFLQKHFGLKLLKMKLLAGYEVKADTMFAALLQL